MLSRLNAWLHLWLGLLTGLVVFVVSITGCLYVFIDELKALVYHERLYVQPQQAAFKPVSEMLGNVQEALGPDYAVSRCDFQPTRDRSWVFRALDINPDGIGHWDYFRYNFRVYVNPYTAAVVHVENTNREFFQIVLALHTHLLLGHKIGQPIVAYSTLIFVLLLISGLILWWPKKWNRKTMRRSLTVKWGAGFKRLNYDLHNVWGFYLLIPALILALTGLVFSFQWVADSFYSVLSGGQPKVVREVPLSQAQQVPSAVPMDQAFVHVLTVHPDADMISMRFRDKDTAPFDFQVRKVKSRTYHFEWAYYDRSSGDFLSSYSTADLNSGEKIRAMNFDLHVGSFMGTWGKILMFIASLVCASLPVTGFFIWYNRKWGKRTKRSKLSRIRTL